VITALDRKCEIHPIRRTANITEQHTFHRRDRRHERYRVGA
jgi:hypothetical protein